MEALKAKLADLEAKQQSIDMQKKMVQKEIEDAMKDHLFRKDLDEIQQRIDRAVHDLRSIPQTSFTPRLGIPMTDLSVFGNDPWATPKKTMIPHGTTLEPEECSKPK